MMTQSVRFLMMMLLLFSVTLVSADSDFFDCNCWFGTVTNIDVANQICDCDCGSTGYVAPFCAYKSSSTDIKLAMATNITNSSEFSGSYLARKLLLGFGYDPATSLEILYIALDDSERHFTRNFQPAYVALFIASNATVATQLMTAAKSETTFRTHFASLGIVEVEIFNPDIAPVPGLAGPYILTAGPVDVNLWDVWWVLWAVFILVWGCCCEGCCCYSNTDERAGGIFDDEYDDSTPTRNVKTGKSPQSPITSSFSAVGPVSSSTAQVKVSPQRRFMSRSGSSDLEVEDYYDEDLEMAAIRHQQFQQQQNPFMTGH